MPPHGPPLETLRRLYYGPTVALRDSIHETLAQDPLFDLSEQLRDGQSLDAQRRLASARMRRLVEYGFVTSDDFPGDPERINALNDCVGEVDWSASVKFSLQQQMVPSVLRSMGTDDHADFIDRSANTEIYGAFALTEVATGSDARNIRTEARFDTATQEFVLHTPVPEATKCWIGGVAKSANYAVVYAQLYDGSGACHGPHAFWVPLRSLETHEPHPGVEIWDVGMKLGQNGGDQGLIAFNHFRIAKGALLNRTGDITADGRYTTPYKSASARYGASLGALSAGRVSITGISLVNARQAITCAIRYGLFRRQFAARDGGEQITILDYPLQQYQLLPLLAGTWVYGIFRRTLFRFFVESQVALVLGDKTERLDLLGRELHALSSASKPVVSWFARDVIQTARECCGGHGYATVKLGVVRNDHDPNMTYEGANAVLIQQTAKYLVGHHHSKRAPASPMGSIDFLGRSDPVPSDGDWADARRYLPTLEALARFMVGETAALAAADAGTSEEQAFWAFARAQPFGAQPTAKLFLELTAIADAHRTVAAWDDGAARAVVSPLVSLFALCVLEKNAGELYRGAILRSPEALTAIRARIVELCAEIRPHAGLLVDAVAPPDYALAMPIGLSRGDPYTNLLQQTKRAPGSFSRPTWWREFRDLPEPGCRRPWEEPPSAKL